MILGINPFNLRPQVKRLFRTPKHVNILKELNLGMLDIDFRNRLLSMQGSLDQMASRYDNLDFVFLNNPEINAVHVKCMNKDFEANSLTITPEDTNRTMARKIYETASNVLLGYKRYDYFNN